MTYKDLKLSLQDENNEMQLYYPVEHLGLLKFIGADVLSWLQGQVTNDVRNLAAGESTSFCFCTPTGQIVADARLHNTNDGFYLELHQSRVEQIIHLVEVMVIMEDVAAVEITGCNCYELFNSAQGWATGYGTTRVWQSELPKGKEITADLYEEFCILEGIPRLGVDYADRTLPPELGKRFEESHVSYTKGCYVGQEVLMRLYSRGHTNKTWQLLTSDKSADPGMKILQDGEPVGTVTRSTNSETFGPIFRAFLSNRVAKDREMQLICDNNVYAICKWFDESLL